MFFWPFKILCLKFLLTFFAFFYWCFCLSLVELWDFFIYFGYSFFDIYNVNNFSGFCLSFIFMTCWTKLRFWVNKFCFTISAFMSFKIFWKPEVIRYLYIFSFNILMIFHLHLFTVVLFLCMIYIYIFFFFFFFHMKASFLVLLQGLPLLIDQIGTFILYQVFMYT